MEDTTCRAYIPDTKQHSSIKNSYDLKTFQSQSRDKHNKKRAANHRLNQKKIETIKNYEKKPIFAFTLLEESISITDKKTKNNLNNQIRKYENKIRSITNCITDEELSKVCGLLDNIGKEIDMIVNKRNFIKLAKKGYFKTKSNLDILKDQNYDSFINNLRMEEKPVMRTPPMFKDSFINRNVSFADKLKQNLT
jgi:hypothetical protein